jgi:hypothetical protein
MVGTSVDNGQTSCRGPIGAVDKETRVRVFEVSHIYGAQSRDSCIVVSALDGGIVCRANGSNRTTTTTIGAEAAARSAASANASGPPQRQQVWDGGRRHGWLRLGRRLVWSRHLKTGVLYPALRTASYHSKAFRCTIPPIGVRWESKDSRWRQSGAWGCKDSALWGCFRPELHQSGERLGYENSIHPQQRLVGSATNAQ